MTRNTDRIRAATNCTVWVIHHTGRTGQHPRGSNAWDGAIWSDLRLTADDMVATITVEKHKDAPSGHRYQYELTTHTVSEKLMPGLPEHARRTLVEFSSDGENFGKILTANENSVRELVENCAGREGLSRTKLVELAIKDGMAESSAYRAVKTLIERHRLRNIGTDKRARYVLAGMAPLPDGSDDD